MTGSDRGQLTHKHQMVWETLRELGIKCVLVDFSGSGDSGQIDDCFPEGSSEHVAFETKTLTADSSRSSILLRDLITDLSYEILQRVEIPDWYNNDGGYGTMEWIAAHTDKKGVRRSDRIAVTVNQAIVEYDTSTFDYDGFGNRAEAE